MKITTKHLSFCAIFLLIFGFVSCGTRTESAESYFDDNISETEYFDDEYTRLNIRYLKDTDMGLSLSDNEYLVLDLK